jgi:predicted transcriptional regulator
VAAPDFRVTDAELSVLKALWIGEPRSARSITMELYRSTTPSDIGTVQKLLQRLEAKRLIKRDRRGHTHQFSTTVNRTEFAGRQLERMARNLTDGSVTPFLMHLVDAKRLSKQDLRELRQLLRESDAET